MRTIFLTTGFFLFFAVTLNAQITDSIRNSVDTFLNKLEQSVLEYEQTVDIAASTNTITAQDIQNRGYDNLDELINSVQGMYLTHDWTNTQYGVRGANPGESNNRRVLILIDNIPLNDPITGRAPSGYELRGIPMENIESVTVVRSPVGVLYGNNAMLGVIKIKTKEARKGLGLFVDAGSFGKYDAGLSVGQRWRNTSFALSARVGSVAGQDIYIPGYGDIIPTGDQMDYSALQFKLNHRNFSIKAGYHQRTGAIAYAEDPVTAPDLISIAFFEQGAFSEQTLYADISYAGDIKENQSVYTRLFLNYDRDEQQLDYLWNTDDLTERNRVLESTWAGAEYQHLFKFQPEHQLLLGTEFWYIPTANYTATVLNEPDANLDFSYWTLGVFAHDSYQISERLAINGGIRADLNSRTDPVFSPQLAMLYSPTEKTTIRAGYSRGYRLPSLIEANVAQELQPLPNPDLIPEASNSLELAWKQQLGRDLNLDIAFYYQQLDDLIPSDPFVPQFINAGTLEAMGLEASVSVDLPEGIQTYLYYNFQFDNTMRVNAPSPLCKFGVTVPFLKHFTLFAEGQYEGSRFTLDGIYTLPFFLMNSNLTFNPKADPANKKNKWLDPLSLSFRVYNLFDQFYLHPSRRAFLPQFVGQNGRTWQAKLALQF
jgi:outer membrane receptor protein involved in Fe transport